MNNAYLSQALKNVRNPNILVNMVSQRVRQLGQGHKALVVSESSVSFMDVALREIAEGKLEFEMTEALNADSIKDRGKKKKK